MLCANSAMRAGAGLVTLGIPKSLSVIIAKRAYLEVMALVLPETSQKSISLASFKEVASFSQKADVLVIGPGLSRNASTQKLVRKIVSDINKPLVLDADALNALVGNLDLLRASSPEPRASRMLTPHAGEFSRLIGRPVDYVQKNREILAKSFARSYNIILVLKSNKTIVINPKGEIYINKTGNPGMSTAGSGDVLAGIIGGLLGQGLSGFEAAKFGVYLHGLAGDAAARKLTQAGMLASDIIENIPSALKLINRKILPA